MAARDPLALPPLRSRIVCRVDAELEPPLEWAPTADWQILQPDGTAIVEARYTLRERHAGELILVNSRGVRTGPPEVLEALRRGETRDPDEYYFRTAVTLEAGPGDYAWVNRALFVAVAARGPASVVYALHQIL